MQAGSDGGGRGRCLPCSVQMEGGVASGSQGDLQIGDGGDEDGSYEEGSYDGADYGGGSASDSSGWVQATVPVVPVVEAVVEVTAGVEPVAVVVTVWRG